MDRGRYDVVLLPIVEVPSLAIPADALVLRSVTDDTCSIATSATAHHEDLLSSVELVDCIADQEIVHCVDEFHFVDAAEVEEKPAFEIGADIASALKGVTMHEDIVGGGEAFHCFKDNSA